jgi:hypothetical protein
LDTTSGGDVLSDTKVDDYVVGKRVCLGVEAANDSEATAEVEVCRNSAKARLETWKRKGLCVDLIGVLWILG